MANFQSNLEKCHLRALGVCKPLLFAGQGSTLRVFKTGERGLNKLLLSRQIFSTLVISGIQTFKNFESVSKIETIVCINGNRFLSVYRFSYNFDDNSCDLSQCLDCHNFYDWILTVKVICDSIFVVKAHNEVVIFDWKSRQIKATISGSDKCILYSAELLSLSDSPIGFVISSGTVFKEIIIWTAYQSQSDSSFVSTNLQRLGGHDGVIFALNYNKELNILVSASDDRSVRIWTSDMRQCSDSLEYWKQNKFTLFHVFYGHLSRIWSVTTISHPFPIVVTVGEDSYVYFWNIEAKKLIQRVDGHKNASLWTMALDSESMIAYFGGSDSCLNSCDIHHSISSFDSLVSHDIHPKQIKFIANESLDIFCSNTSGDLILMSSNSSCLENKTVFDYKDIFSTYSAIDINEDRNQIILGSKSGEIALIKVIDNRFDITIKSIQNSKVFSICFVNSTKFITCGIEGKITSMSTKELVPISEHTLPPSRHRWPTAALLVEDLLIIGDRCGSVFIYSERNENPNKEYRHLHGSNGVTAIRAKPNSALVYSSGRNGKIFEYLLENKSCSLLRTFRIFSDMEWIGDFQFDRNSSQMSFVCGFQSRNFVVWDERQQTFVERVECGGGHRSWDFTLHENHFHLCYTKNERIYYLKKKLSKIDTKTEHRITKPSHTKKINCCSLVFTTDSCLHFATAGEDNVIHLNRVDIASNDWQIESYLFGHISNISAMSCVKPDNQKDICYLISVGGRSQLMVWQIARTDGNLIVRQLFNKFLWKSDKLQNRVYKTNNNIASTDPQIRYLDVNISLYSDNKFLVSTACSDSAVRLFLFDINSNTFELILIKEFNSNCILRVVNSFSNTLITASNDGSMKLWSLQTKDIMSGDCDQMDLKTLVDINCHECGVNAIDLYRINDHYWLIASGGDDNSLVLSVVKNDSNNSTLVCNYEQKYIHSSQITAIRILSDSHFISAAIDQRVIVWNYSFDEKNMRLDAKPIGSYVSCIADISSLMSSFVPHCKRQLKTIVCGEGFQVIDIGLTVNS